MRLVVQDFYLFDVFHRNVKSVPLIGRSGAGGVREIQPLKIYLQLFRHNSLVGNLVLIVLVLDKSGPGRVKPGIHVFRRPWLL